MKSRNSKSQPRSIRSSLETLNSVKRKEVYLKSLKNQRDLVFQKYFSPYQKLYEEISKFSSIKNKEKRVVLPVDTFKS
jgi:hypothetical protein